MRFSGCNKRMSAENIISIYRTHLRSAECIVDITHHTRRISLQLTQDMTNPLSDAPASRVAHVGSRHNPTAARAISCLPGRTKTKYGLGEDA